MKANHVHLRLNLTYYSLLLIDLIHGFKYAIYLCVYVKSSQFHLYSPKSQRALHHNLYNTQHPLSLDPSK